MLYCLPKLPLNGSLFHFSIELWLTADKENIARIANAVQVTICLLVSTSVYYPKSKSLSL